MMRRIKARLKGTAGFTLGEILVVVLILLMVSAVMAAGIPSAANAYRKVVDAANAQTLLSTTMTALRDELTSAREVSVGNDQKSVEYLSGSGVRSRISTGYVDNAAYRGIGLEYLPYSGSADSASGRLLVSAAASNRNLTVSFDSVSFDEDDDSLLIFSDIIVTKNTGDGSMELASADSLQIRVFSQAAP